MKKKFRIIIAAMLCICLTIGVTGCAALEDTINEIQGILTGYGYTFRTYDNDGYIVMTSVGDKIIVKGN